jgi:hypothetical protein
MNSFSIEHFIILLMILVPVALVGYFALKFLKRK